jgi:hypothetical protein
LVIVSSLDRWATKAECSTVGATLVLKCALDHVTTDAQALLRAAQEIHAERHGIQTFTLGTHLPLEEAGRRTGLNPNRLRYYDAIKELEYEGAIEWDESARYARGDKRYIITERGLKMLGEPD